MKVLLCQDIKKLGWLGDVVEVKTGYARNYLIPEGLAMVPTESNLASLADAKAKRAEERLAEKERMSVAAEAVGGAEVVIAAKANEQGHLFGSVGAGAIAENLRQQGFEVADDIVRLRENIKEVGTTEVTLKFASDLTATVNVIVVSSEAAGEVEETATEAEEALGETERQDKSEPTDTDK